MNAHRRWPPAPSPGNAGALTGRVTVRPVRTQTPPAIDGRLDDEVWSDAYRDSAISSRASRSMVRPATEETDVYLAYDSSNIYLGFPCSIRRSRDHARQPCRA